MSRLEQTAIAFDQLLNAIANGMADETLSARLYRHRENHHIMYRLINGLFFWQDDHCEEAYLSEITRRHLPKEYRK